MKQLQTLIFLLSSIIIGVSCNPLKGFHEIENKESTLIHLSPIIDSTTKSTIFKAKLNVYDTYISGLFLIKYMQRDSAIHIVYLSEVGLNLFDFKYKDGIFTVVNCQEFLNKKIIIQTLMNDFSLLFFELSNQKKYKIYQNENDSTLAIKYRNKWNNFYYFCTNNSTINRIYRKSYLFGSVNVMISYKDLILETINFKHTGIKYEMNLVRIIKDE